MDTPRCKTRKDTKSCLLGAIVAMLIEAKDGKIATISHFEAILEGFAL